MENKKLELVAVSQEETNSELPEYERELRAEMERMLTYALGRGWCTVDDVNDWLVAFDDCEKTEYRENLVMIMAERCLPSGEEAADEYGEIVKSPYLPPARRLELETKLHNAGARERETILAEIKKEIAAKEKQYAVFSRLLLKIRTASLNKQLERKFADADLAEAKKIVDQLMAQEAKRELLQVTEPDVQLTLDRIRPLISVNKFSEARSLLDQIGTALNFSGTYRDLSQEIDQKEIEMARIQLQAA